jgi:hypothetical protein
MVKDKEASGSKMVWEKRYEMFLENGGLGSRNGDGVECEMLKLGSVRSDMVGS